MPMLSQAEGKAPARAAFLKLQVLTHATPSHSELHAVVKEQAQVNGSTIDTRGDGQGRRSIQNNQSALAPIPEPERQA